ncbi:MAG: FUSC family protein [Flavipsychrobacter sp.]
MRFIKPYRQINNLIQQEAIEPLFSWGIRMALVTVLPIIWGIYTGHVEAASWIAFSAECICWVELKGDYFQRLKILLGGIILIPFFTYVGVASSNSIWLSVLLMLGVGFLSGLFKNLGERGSGLALCVYIIYIFNNAYPHNESAGLYDRLYYAVIGSSLNAAIGMLASILIPAAQPYRRTIAVIWKSVAQLTQAISKGWEGIDVRSSDHDIYLKEVELRKAIDSSLVFFEKSAHQTTSQDGKEHQLAQLRKTAAITGSHIQAMGEELSTLSIKGMDDSLRIKIYTILRAQLQTLERLVVYTASLKQEEELIILSRINRIDKLTEIIKQTKLPEEDKGAIERFIHLSERSTRLLQHATNTINELSDDSIVLKTYPVLKTLLILHPKYWTQGIRALFNFNTFTIRYALRAAIAATLAMFIYKWFDIDHGYWIPFTLMIVSQTYIGATVKKARDRIIGTILGGLAGGLLLYLPASLFIKETLLFLSTVPMIIYLQKNYAISVFFLTLGLVLLFNISDTIDNQLIITRALATTAGAGLAIIAGYVLLPHKDQKAIPLLLVNAIRSNHDYFLSTFYNIKDKQSWTLYKRKGETGNSNTFDSISRYIQEPSFRKKPYKIFYYVVMHNIRITRELNNIQLETTDSNTGELTETQKELITNCLQLFNKNEALLSQIATQYQPNTEQPSSFSTISLNNQQEIYLDKLYVELKAINYDLEILAQKVSRIIQL